MATRRAEQKARTRAKVLEAARSSFEALGYEGTTIATVAERAGVSVGTVMGHFPDKSALVAAAFHDAIEEVVQEALQTMPEGPLVTRLLHMSGLLYRFYGRDPALSAALVRETTFMEGPAMDPLTAQIGRQFAWLGQELAAAQARGEVAPDLDPRVAVLGYWADYYLVLLMGLRGERLGLDAQLGLLGGLLRMRLRPRV